MTSSSKALWEQCLELIKSKVQPVTFNAWFRPIVFSSYNPDDHKLALKLPSMDFYEYLEGNYTALLGQVLTEVYGPGVQLFYSVLTDQEHNIRTPYESDPPQAVGTSSRPVADGETEKPQQGTPDQQLDSQLNPHLTFKNYIEGQSNRLPRSIGLSIAEHPQTMQFNPMFIYGPSGCGKTHLVNAIGLRTKQLYPQKRVLYVSARLFQVQYTTAVLQNATNDFIRFYQTIDMLIVDDIQEWMSATKTQEAFFHIFNHLYKNGRRIILASDRPPVELKTMPDRLLTRFSGGLIAELEKPNVQLCIDILESRMRRDGLQLSPQVVQFIAENAGESVRELEGVVNGLLAYSITYSCPIDIRLAERCIRRAVDIDDKPITVDDILEKVSAFYKVTTQAVAGRSRKKEIVLARQVAMYLAQKHTRMPASRIGKLIAGRDHSTVVHSCQKVEMRLKTDAAFSDEVASIETSFNIKH